MLELSILGRKMPVRFVSDRELNALAEDTDCLGLYLRGSIYISTSVPQEEVKRVLLHEISHAVLEISGLHNLFDPKQEEAICEVFESFLEVFQTESLVKFMNETGEN